MQTYQFHALLLQTLSFLLIKALLFAPIKHFLSQHPLISLYIKKTSYEEEFPAPLQGSLVQFKPYFVITGVENALYSYLGCLLHDLSML